MLKFEVKINDIWTELNPVFDKFKIIKYRHAVQLLHIRYETAGTLKLYGSDFDLLEPHINTYNIECRITEQINGNSVYDAYLNLNDEINLTTDFISATIFIKDKYYEIENNEININSNINIWDFKNTWEKVHFTKTRINPYQSALRTYIPFAFHLKTLIKEIFILINGVGNINYNYLPLTFLNMILIPKDKLENNYFSIRNMAMQQNSNVFSDLDSANFKEYFNVKLTDIFTMFCEIFKVFWEYDNVGYGAINFYPYDNFILTTNGINFTNHLNRNWENENYRIIKINKLIGKYFFRNSQKNIYKINTEHSKTNENNYFFDREMKFNINSIEEKEFSFPYTVNFITNKNEDVRKEIIGDGLIYSSQILQHHYFRDETSYNDNLETIHLSFDGNNVNNPLINGAVLGAEDCGTKVFTYTDSTYNTIKYIAHRASELDNISFFSKYIWLKEDEDITINIKTYNSDEVLKVELVPIGQPYKLMSFTVGNDQDVTESTTARQSTWHRFNFFGLGTLTNDWEGEITITQYQTTPVTNTNIDDDFFIYNEYLSLKEIIKNYGAKNEINKCTVKSLQPNYNDEEEFEFSKANDKTQIISAPINENFENIDFSKKMFTNSLGWSRVDRIEREYNKDYNSLCTITLTNK